MHDDILRAPRVCAAKRRLLDDHTRKTTSAQSSRRSRTCSQRVTEVRQSTWRWPSRCKDGAQVKQHVLKKILESSSRQGRLMSLAQGNEDMELLRKKSLFHAVGPVAQAQVCAVLESIIGMLAG